MYLSPKFLVLRLILLYFGRFLLFIFGFLLLYALAFFVCAHIPVGGGAEGPKKHTIHVLSNGVHTDIILALEDVPERLRNQLTVRPGTRYVAFGWGDKGFYLDTPTWAELRASVAFKAALLPSPTAMHVTYYPAVGPDWYPVRISAAQLADGLAFLYPSFRLTETGLIQPIPDKGYGTNDDFYEAVGNYSMFYTCNVWANQYLKEMDIRTAIWAPFDWAILRWRQA